MTDNSSKQPDRDEAASGSTNKSEGPQRGGSSEDFYRAVAQLEASLQDLVGQKKDETLRQATAFINDAKARLSDQIGDRDHDSVTYQPRQRRRAKERLFRLQPGSDHLYRGPNSKIAGVCAGFARYFGLEAWVMRLIAVTGVIFIPTLVLPAYLAAYFVMDTSPQGGSRRRYARGRTNSRRFARRARVAAKSGKAAETVQGEYAQVDYVAAAPDWPPRRMLNHSRADFAQAELRLRRIESFVTSDQYELQKELRKMEQ